MYYLYHCHKVLCHVQFISTRSQTEFALHMQKLVQLSVLTRTYGGLCVVVLLYGNDIDQEWVINIVREYEAMKHHML
ncbi:hypothetical protein HanRHA438_Chr05g0209751 [Helianthus annuus]|uniref:Uncharacterized protein n=1 Tax=Helianthus annuus TaxID=4232 RepID=A0A9K3IXY6_HELAN|nr:hypothetical protein HanXRQr2_Chr05g0200051 [Helianthus annuus]KAJ0569272.1 hypothetical protein HanHA300_Chr05g0164221 [Helianthus annuus]KAJ0575709.1 hypothetical protein HanIR_Chr05g0215861 [Helianthus annuus]KAJ0583580.1 hypothetical protein HanHA89_Chr05g0178251 [Helianthus annuus]KAJ0917766.1 hypothetical protein HanRHA438_Chr05g0209751 [Helianthus annuus]